MLQLKSTVATSFSPISQPTTHTQRSMYTSLLVEWIDQRQVQIRDRREEGKGRPSLEKNKKETQRSGQVEKIPHKREAVNYGIVKSQWQHVKV